MVLLFDFLKMCFHSFIFAFWLIQTLSAESVFKGDSAVWSSPCWPEDWFIFILQLVKLRCQSGPLKGLSQAFIKPTPTAHFFSILCVLDLTLPCQSARFYSL